MNRVFSGYLKCLLLFTLALTPLVSAFSTDSACESFVRIPGHIPRQAVFSKSVFLKSLDAYQIVPLTFVLPLRNQEELEELVRRIHDPSDQEHYGKFLTTEEFIDRFAPTQEDYQKVIAYAHELGLTVSGIHPNRTLVNAAGPANAIEVGLKLNLYRYHLRSGQKFYAPDNNPAIPVHMASIIQGIVGLDNLAVWHTYKHRKNATLHTSNARAHAYPSGPGGGFAPNDLLIAYNLGGVQANGAGQSIALFELASYQASDINTYASHFGLPTPKLKNIFVDGGSGAGIDAEVTLDIELALALAPESQIYVYEGPNSNQGVIDTYNRIATDNLAKQVSTSWGLGEDLATAQFLNAENNIFMQMAAQGQTIYAAAGDSGAYDDYPSKKVLVVDDPASQPYVVGVGGTTLNVNPQTCAYVSESVWNNGLGNGAGGGGVSKIWPIPDWQKNVPSIYSKTNRNVPDVSLNADTNTGYAIFHNGQWAIFGGTSCAAPLWAAFTARVNQELVAHHKPVLGFANPVLYAIGAIVTSVKNFNDVLTGTNLFYGAGANYDNATGWGSFNGVNLFVSLTNPSLIPFPTPTPPSLQLSPELNVLMMHSDPFIKGKIATYQISVFNNGDGPTSGEVVVKVDLPHGLEYLSSSASGWVFNKAKKVFKRSDVLNPDESYPTITLKVQVGRSASSLLNPTVTVSGGGSSSNTDSDPTHLVRR